jgi:glutathionylspermidine synthase
VSDKREFAVRRYTIEPRNAWLERIAHAGVVLGHQAPCCVWNERSCVEVSMCEAEALQAHTETLYHKMVCLTEQAIEERSLSEFTFTLEEQRFIARSWELSDYAPSLFTRFDYRFDEAGVPRFCGVESGLTCGLLETAVAQWDWLLETAPWTSQFNTISERLTESWREYQLIGRVVHFAYDDGDPRDTNIAEYLWDSALAAGVYAVATPMSALCIDDSLGLLCDAHGNRVDVLITANDRARVSGATLWEYAGRADICLVEPHWKRLWQSPQWMEYCEQAAFEDQQLDMRGTLMPGMLGDLICSVWIVAGEISGLGFSLVQNHVCRNTLEYIPHLMIPDGGRRI